MKELIEENRKKRELFLKKIHELSGGSTTENVDVFDNEIYDQMTSTQDEIKGFVNYWKTEGAIVDAPGASNVSITNEGIQEVKKMINPEKPTEPASVINIYGNNNNSPIQQGTHNSSQTVTFGQQDIEKVKEFVEEFKKKLPEMKLTEDERDEVESMVVAAESQFSMKKPNREILKTSVKYLGAVTEKVGVNLISHGIIEGIKGVF